MTAKRAPKELSEQLSRGNVVAFAGAGISLSTGVLPSGKILANELCARAGFTNSDDLSVAARSYETRMGRQSLLDYIGTRINQKIAPTALHSEFTHAPFRAIITTNWDELIERAFENNGKNYFRVVRDEDVPFLSSDCVPVIKLHGTISQRDTLVVAEADYYNLFSVRPAIANLLRSWFLSSSMLFVGYALQDSDFKQLFYECKRVLGPLQRRGYAVQMKPNPTEVDNLRRDNIEVIDEDAAVFMHDLTH